MRAQRARFGTMLPMGVPFWRRRSAANSRPSHAGPRPTVDFSTVGAVCDAVDSDVNREAAGEMSTRGWWTALPTGTGTFSTYSRVEVDALPPIPARLLESLRWLEDVPSAALEDSILRADQAQRVLSPEVVAWLTEQGVPAAHVPECLSALAANPGLLAGIRTPTMCFVDLGDKVVTVADSAGGGWLIRWLTDSQAVLSWLIHITSDGRHRIVVSPALIGYAYEPDAGEPYAVPSHPLTSTDLETLSVEECAGSLTAFLARLWLESEAWWALHGESPATAEVTEYVSTWRKLYP